jgi:hypothetical protein
VSRLAVAALSIGATVPACGCASRGEDPAAATEVRIDTTAAVADPAPNATVEDTTRDVSEENDVPATGSATLTIGERTWRFGGVVCLVGPDAAAVDATFSLAASGGGFDLFVAQKDDGDVITLVASDSDLQLTTAAGPTDNDTDNELHFLRIDGPAVTATASFVEVGATTSGTASEKDDVTATVEAPPAEEGTLDASCE